MNTPLLDIENLHTRFETEKGIVHAVNGVSFRVEPGEIVGIVGESGSGKSVTALSVIGLEAPGEVVDGSITFDGRDLTALSERERRRIRGTGISMVFQDPNATLNPVFTVGEQIAESVRIHESPASQGLLDYLDIPLFRNRQRWNAAHQRAVELMEQVGISNAETRSSAYPHEFSGGMRQRAMLAIALASDPDLLIADEPTTALDTTTQARILGMLRESTDTHDTSVFLISHDIGVIAETCDRIVVMYGGEVMETGPTESVLTNPKHPYTRALLDCLPQRTEPTERLRQIEGEVPTAVGGHVGCPFAPRCEHRTEACEQGTVPTIEIDDDRSVTCGELDRIGRRVSDGYHREKLSDEQLEKETSTWSDFSGNSSATTAPLVRVRGVSKRFPINDSLLARLTGEREDVRALSDVTLDINESETLGLVGESGSGKSTLADLITGVTAPTAGEIRIAGTPVGTIEDRTSSQLSDIGVVFQHPRSSLDPRWTVERTLTEPLHQRDWSASHREKRVEELLKLVGLSQRHATSYPHQLSGGEVQRVALARALALEPRLVVLDEPVSALDVSVQAKILHLLSDLQDRLDLTYLFVSHDLSVVKHLADRVAVLCLGEVMEVGPAAQLFDQPSHPYTEALLNAIPSVDPTAPTTAAPPKREEVDATNPPSGCVYHSRCPFAEAECESTDPSYRQMGDAQSRCLFAEEFAARESETEIPDAEPQRAYRPAANGANQNQ